MRHKLEVALSVILTVAAVTIAAALVRREFFYSPQRRVLLADRATAPPEYVEEWRSILTHGVPFSGQDAPIKIIEFADLECPSCRTYAPRLKSMKQQYPGQVEIVFVHLPLTFHRFARIAATAAECAGDQGKFGAIAELIFQKQDSLGLKSWGSIAREAGVADTALHSRCMAAPKSSARIDSGVAIAGRLGITGTPTIIINGWRFRSPPDSAAMSRTIDAILSGADPQRAAGTKG